MILEAMAIRDVTPDLDIVEVKTDLQTSQGYKYGAVYIFRFFDGRLFCLLSIQILEK